MKIEIKVCSDYSKLYSHTCRNILIDIFIIQISFYEHSTSTYAIYIPTTCMYIVFDT